MSTKDLWPMYEDSILELFEEAKSCDPDLFMRSLTVPRESVVAQFPDGSERRFSVRDESSEMEIAQAFMTVQKYEQAVRDDKIDKRVRTPLALMLSFSLLEADLWHNILRNLLKVIAGEELRKNLFGAPALDSKYRQMVRLLKKCSRKKPLSMCDVYPTICNADIIDLRNAFSHSQYVLSPGGDVVLTEWFPVTKKRPANKEGQFSFGYIQDVFRRTLTFLTVLAQLRRKFLKYASMGARQS